MSGAPARSGGGACAALLVVLLALAGCSTAPVAPGKGKGASSGARGSADGSAARPSSASRGGAYYLDDGPGDNPPPDLLAVPDAAPRAEPLHPFANRPYSVFGVSYVPRPDLTEHRERGIASWYGRKFHGRRTSSGEPYDMYAMTAAHPTLPIPSYVRVTHLRNGRSVVVRVNDRGPFLHRRVIDLSYTAAYRLGYVDNGHAEVEVELLSPSGAARPPMQASVRSDAVPQAAARSDAVPARAFARPDPAQVSMEPVAPTPMLAEEVPLERLSLETTIDDRPLSASVPAAASVPAVATVRTVAPAAASPASAAPGAAPAASAASGAPGVSAASPGPAPPGAGAAQERGTWLQIGAFASRGNAEAARARFSREAPWLAMPVDVLRQGDTWRVQIGPWPSREDALAAAARIASNGAFRPIPVAR